MKNYPYILPSDEVFSEVLDMHDNPFMVIPHKQMVQQGIPHRKVYIIFQDKMGRVLLKRSSKTQSLYIPNTIVHAGEARKYAAMRVLKAFFKLNAEHPLHLEERTLKSYKYHTFFMVLLDEEDPKSLSKKVIWLDFDELQGFVNHFADMLDERLLELITQGHLQNLCSANINKT